MTQLLRRVATIALAAAALACQDSTGPDKDAVAGSYTATTFTTVTSGTTTNQLAAGATLSITLRVDGTTTGQLFIPASTSGGAAVNEAMNGTWTLSGTTVDFAQSADTFVRDMPFVVEGGALVGDQIFGDTRIVVILTKQPAAT